jgi:hypothetical protein
VWSRSPLTYGLFVFSHVTLSISTVQTARNRRSWARQYHSLQSQTHHFVSLGSPDQIVAREQHTGNILEPFRSYRHGRSETCIERGIDIGRSVVRSRVLLVSVSYKLHNGRLQTYEPSERFGCCARQLARVAWRILTSYAKHVIQMSHSIQQGQCAQYELIGCKVF